MNQRLRAGVVGAGVFGGHHARKYASLPDVELAGVFDPHQERAEALAGPLGARAFDDLDALLAATDLVTVASPASAHAGAAAAALRAGRHVYVEKPLADRAEDAWALVDAARTAGTVLACGHQERVVFRAMGLLDVPEQPIRLEALRHGPASERSQDVSAVLDLMVHDVDLALSLTAAAPLTGGLRASGGWDDTRAELAFDDGFVARFDVSRRAPARKRTMRVVFPSGEVEIDFVARSFRNTTPFALDPDFAETPAGRDPLGASVASFLKAVRGAAPRPVVTAGEAIRALDVALAVEGAAEIGAPA